MTKKYSDPPPSPFTIGNIRYFIAFRVFFNARFYYPVFTILFLDYGLTLEQFALLNSVWAATIVIAEVPSGALADLLGRKQLLLITSFLMMGEMMLLSFVPLGNSTIIFWTFFLNRVFSGLAEAMASGADEALAYDTLVEQGNTKDWPRVLSLMMRIKAIGAIIAMSIGALIYDPEIINSLMSLCGFPTTVTQQMSMRYPIYLTLVLSVFSCLSVMMMTETRPIERKSTQGSMLVRLWQLLLLMWKAGKWILTTPFPLAIILLGMTYDHALRMIITMTSQYFRLIQLPESSFGVIGAALSLLGIFIPKIAEKMVQRYSPLQIIGWMSLITFSGILGLVGFFPYVGIIPMACVSAGIMFTSFFTSHYLNRITPSHQRATVLSFKGLAFNLAYGLIGIFFATLIIKIRVHNTNLHPQWADQQIENHSFMDAMGWFPWYTAIVLAIIFFYCGHRLKGSHIHKEKG